MLLVPGCSAKLQDGGVCVQFLATVDKNFTRLETSHEAEILVSDLSLVELSMGQKKKGHFRVDFSFKHLHSFK